MPGVKEYMGNVRGTNFFKYVSRVPLRSKHGKLWHVYHQHTECDMQIKEHSRDKILDNSRIFKQLNFFFIWIQTFSIFELYWFLSDIFYTAQLEKFVFTWASSYPLQKKKKLKLFTDIPLTSLRRCLPVLHYSTYGIFLPNTNSSFCQVSFI